MKPRVILLHGFGDEELSEILRAVKKTVADPDDVAFATTTETNLRWNVGDLMDHVREEHETWKKRENSAG